jgi:hypothetical protein
MGTNSAENAITLTTEQRESLKNYIRYRVDGGEWMYLGETTGGQTSWTGTLPLAEGEAADFAVSAALFGADGIERDSWNTSQASHEVVRYTRPFSPGPTPGAPSGVLVE